MASSTPTFDVRFTGNNPPKMTPTNFKAPIKFSPNIEQPSPTEDETIKSIIATMSGWGDKTASQDPQHHHIRTSHAKNLGCLVGTLTINPDLPPELSTGPAEKLHDKVSVHRGIAIKIFDVKGDTIKQHENPQSHTQDFLLVTGTTFPSGTAEGFLRDSKALGSTTGAPEVLKSGVATAARVVARGMEALGTETKLGRWLGEEYTHPFVDQYFSQCPIRYGDFVAKIAAFPQEDSESYKRLKDIQVDTSNDPDTFRTAVTTALRHESITYDIKVQLWNNPDTQPIEDASVEWSEDESPFRTVATLKFDVQDPDSKERQEFFDEKMVFRPAHSLKVYRPLGSVMRARMGVYEEMSKKRHEENHVPVVEPMGVDQIPAWKMNIIKTTL